MLRVLLVDDEPLFREGVKQTIDWISLDAYIPDEAIDGVDALQKMQSKTYDYVITDMIMPKMNGLAFLSLATKRFPLTNYIVLSGYDDFSLVKESFRLGIVDYILKSELDYEQLLLVIEKQQHLRSKTSMFSGNEGLGEINLFYMKQGYLRNTCKVFDEVDLRCMADLGLPYSREDGVIYAAALRLHFSMELVEKDGIKALKSQLSQAIDYSIMKTKDFLSMEVDGFFYLFYISKSQKSWKELTDIWTHMHIKLTEELQPTVSVISLGFSQFGAVMGEVRTAIEEASYYASFFYVGGVGKIYSEPKICTLQNTTDQKVPSLRDLVSGLYHLQYPQVAEYLEQLTFSLGNVRGYSPEQIINHFRNIFVLCNSFIESEGALLGKELVDVVQEYETLVCADADLPALNEWVMHIAQIIREQHAFSSRIFLRVQSCIQSAYMHDISLESVAHKLQLNPAYVSRVFTKDTGICFSAYLTQYRIEKAIELMAQSNSKLYEIAEAVGFNNSETFSRAFKRVKGISPQSYMKQVK